MLPEIAPRRIPTTFATAPAFEYRIFSAEELRQQIPVFYLNPQCWLFGANAASKPKWQDSLKQSDPKTIADSA